MHQKPRVQQSPELILTESGIPPLRRQTTTALQLNIGLYCNQACSHCHVESSPVRTEMMDEATAQRCLHLLAASNDVTCLDITGGAPELNSQFRPLVQAARALSPDLTIIDRCNLTVLCEPGQEDLAGFLAQHRVRVVASLPCYGADNVDKQRGRGVFDRSIQGLKALNAVGYGQPGTGLVLDLVYNPGGAFLAPPQDKLQPAYKQELAEAYGIHFNSLLCLNNMPIKRFADWLIRQDQLSAYMAQLVEAFNPGAVTGVMCHNTLSVAWDGRLYDCDFNQQLELPLARKAAATTAQAAAAAAGGGGGGGEDTREYTAEQVQQQLAAQGAAASHGNLFDTSQQASRVGAAAVGPDTWQESQQEIDLVRLQHQKPGLTVWDIASLSELTGLPVCTGSHCYGCTAGSGSSCQGATAAA
eukprot:gene10742-10897_t